MTTSGARETVATLILGYAAPARPEWHQRMVWYIAWCVALLPFLKLTCHWIEIYSLGLADILKPATQSPTALVYLALSLVVEPCAAIFVSITTLYCLYRRHLGRFAHIVFLSYIALCVLEGLLWRTWYGSYLITLRYVDFLPAQLSLFALVAFPILLLLLLNPSSIAPTKIFARRLALLLLLSCATGAAAMIHYWLTTPYAWHGPVIDFWQFLEGNPQPTARCLGQLTLNVGILGLILLLAFSLITRRSSPTLLRAMTSLLFVGWCLRLLEGTGWRIYALFKTLPWSPPESIYGSLNGFFAFPDVRYFYSTFRSLQHILDALNFSSTALIALIFILSLRIAINRPELNSQPQSEPAA